MYAIRSYYDASYAEVSLRRQVGRDGSSTYFINGSKCRRKDITQLFLGTGLGSRSYAIIEQNIRITSYNVCYTKLLRTGPAGSAVPAT